MNTIINEINFSNAKKMNCALMFMLSNHYGIKCVSNLLQLEPCNDMFKVVYDIWHIALICEIQLLLNCALMFILSNHHGIKCVSNLL